MFLLYFLLFLLLLGFSNYLIQKVRKDLSLKRKFYDFRDNNAIVYTVLTMILVYFAVNLFVPDPTFKTTEEKIAYGKETSQPWLVSQSYRALLATDSMNPDLAFGLIDAHFDPAQNLCPDYRAYNHEEGFIYNYFKRFADSDEQEKSDFGNLFIGLYNFYKGDEYNAGTSFAEVKNQNLKYLNNFQGRVNFYNHNRERGYANLLREIELKGYTAGAYRNLALLYDFEQKHTELFLLTYNPESRPYVPYAIRTGVYIRSNDLGSYFKDLFSEVILSGNVVGIAGAFLILLAWVIYLLRVNIQRSSGIVTALFVVLFSAVMMIPVWLLYDFFEFGLGFTLNGEVFNDLMYCIFGIGVIEEFVKIVPFLLLLFFTKKIKEPIDYIMYASLAALGFAFVENILYFQEDSLNIMHSRALTASISHMIDSSIVAYGLILARFKYKRNSVLYFFLFFFLAAVSHGFYDFWLLNDVVSDYSIVTFFYLLTSILIYASLINNALNQATEPSANIHLNSAKLSSNLAAWLVGVFLFEFICLTWIYGPTISNRELITSTLGGGYLILFLSVRLGNIDIFPGEWYRINWFVGLLPAQVVYGDKRPNYNLALGKKVLIQNFRTNSKLATFLPVRGEIIRREKIGGFTGWYLVKLEQKIPFKTYNQEHIMIRPKNMVELLHADHDTIFHFSAVPNMDELNGPNKNEKSIVFFDWVKVREISGAN
ncbi:MAG TPA: PrsW family glutamic-type intramembrane protease [Bacteroidia bacterium]|nr:PrsW family glutamic-type intramembrane protease [Bacteroidia bacterium]